MTDHDRLHTCHDECPCQTGGEPTPDFLPVESVPAFGWYAYLQLPVERRAAPPRKDAK